MGSSKKHKEKRERKKRKRNRSRSLERDSHKSRHKSDKRRKDKSRSSEERISDVEIANSSKKRRFSGEDETNNIPTVTHGASDDEFDVDKLLDSKLSENYQTSKLSQKRKLECVSNEDSLEKFATEQLMEDLQITSKSFSGIKVKEEPSDIPSTSRGHVEALSIVETNKLRAKLGLKPLEIKKEKREESADADAANKPRLKSCLKTPIIKQEQNSSPKVMETNKRTGENHLGLGEEESREHHESLSIAETNKLRAKLGLKPLDVGNDSSDVDSACQEISKKPEEVFVKTENISEKKKSEALREKLKVMKEKRAIEEKLRKTRGVADSDSEDEPASAWVLKHQKLQEEKEKAEKRAKMLEEMDAEFGIGTLVAEEFDKKKNYTDKNLKGLTVAHDIESFEEGHQVILTLQDKGVLDEGEDVLENVNIVDSEKYAKNVENKKKKPDYKPYEEPEFDEFGILKKKNLLSKYDEEIEGEKKKTFKIGNESGSTYISKEKELELIRMKLKQQNEISLEMPTLKIANEYFTPQEMVQFKKPKKRRKVPKAAPLKADDLLPDAAVENDLGSRRNPRHRNLDDDDDMAQYVSNEPIPFISYTAGDTIESPLAIDESTDKELHGALNKAKKLKQRVVLASAPEKVIELLGSSSGGSSSQNSGPAVNIELNSVAEFCRTLGDIPTYGLSGNRDEEADDMMDLERELLEERQKQELDAQNQGAWNEVDIEEKPAEISTRENEPILEEEPDISLGIAGALKLATKKGYLDKDDKKHATAARASQLQAKSYTIEEKFYEDDKFGKRDRYTGPVQEFKEKNNYKPDVKLEYIDDSGRILTAKEAFRYLSHKFHGKGPGKNKVDKRMKKLDQDTRLKQMSSTDTPLNTVKLLQQKQKETQSPYIVLSGGSKTLTQTMISKTKMV